MAAWSRCISGMSLPAGIALGPAALTVSHDEIAFFMREGCACTVTCYTIHRMCSWPSHSSHCCCACPPLPRPSFLQCRLLTAGMRATPCRPHQAGLPRSSVPGRCNRQLVGYEQCGPAQVMAPHRPCPPRPRPLFRPRLPSSSLAVQYMYRGRAHPRCSGEGL